MSIPLLFFTSAIVGLGSKAFSKLCSNTLNQTITAKYSLVLVINSFVACVFFGISGGLNITVNGVTFLYSVIYAVITAVAIISNVIVYRYASISNVNIVSSSCIMVCTAIVGWMFFSEKVDILNVIRLIIMLVAILFVSFDQKKNKNSPKPTVKRKNENNFSLVLTIAVITVCGCANTVVLKAFAMSKRVTDENSFFFFTNIILLIVAFIVFIVVCLSKKGGFKKSVELLYPKKLIAICGNTVCSNISTIIGVMIVAQLDVSIYSPISSALGIITGLVGSLMFREKLGVFAYVAVAFACIAVVI